MVKLPVKTLVALATFCLTLPAAAQAPLTVPDPRGDITVLADQLEQVGEDGIVIATGNVEITRGASRLTADRVEYNRQTGEAVAHGRVVLYDGPDRLLGDRIDYNFKTETGVVHSASAFSEPYYRLTGERMERIEERVYRIHRGVFTTCEGDLPAWSVHARTATADLDNFVVGRDASFWVGRIPLIPWIPFFAAAIRRERQTGFLMPTLGTSNQKGFFTKLPFFWAISDSQDLTASLDVFAKRGVGAGGEYRYILSESSRGSVSGFFIQETLKDDDGRGTGSLKHEWEIAPRLTLKADVNMVSDDQYYREYADRLHDRSLQRAESNVSLIRRWDSWNFVANTFWYQDLTTRRPVELQRLPELRLKGVRQPVPGASWLLYETDASFVNFVRDVGSDGTRLDLHPRVFLPLSLGGVVTVTPFLGGRGTYYDKRVVGKRLTRDGAIEVELTEDASRIRAQGEVGADVEARASRIYEVGGVAGIDRLQHLIEPRVNITEIRGVNQKGLPQFDPSGGVVNPIDLPEAALGIDRIGKVSKLTYSLTNRLNAKTVAGPGQEPVRWELVRFVLGQSFSLLPEAVEPFSEVRGELSVQPNRIFGFRGDASYDVYGRGFQTANTDVTATVRDVTASVGTRFNDRERIEFIRGELQAAVSRFVDLRGSTHWDTRNRTVVESRVGVDLHPGCPVRCWTIGLEYVDRTRGEDEFRFSVNLLGLGSVGGGGAAGGR
ncbi:MAG: LPS-assembly protein LptD [Candidatus Rokubacteria bacterium]|nr:LPS-assembly protein LptD [Candidatus Rokubacteria bacterium]